MSIGSRIKELREIKGFDRSAFAKKIGVTVGAVSNYENGVSSPKEPILYKIIECLECDANYIFQDAVKMPDMKDRVNPKEMKLVNRYKNLTLEGRRAIDTLINSLPTSSFTKDYLLQEAAHETKGLTDEEKQADDNVMKNFDKY